MFVSEITVYFSVETGIVCVKYMTINMTKIVGLYVSVMSYLNGFELWPGFNWDTAYINNALFCFILDVTTMFSHVSYACGGGNQSQPDLNYQ